MAIGVVAVIWAVPQRSSASLGSIPSQRRLWTGSAILAMAFLILFLACYIAGCLVWEDFTYYDNSHFTNGTLVGHNVALQILPKMGRFWPLGHQEFNLLRHITRSVAGYHGFRIAQLLLVCGVLLVLDDELDITARVPLITLALITPSILISFSGLIYAEANVLVWLVLLAWSVKRFEQTQSVAWAVAAAVSAQFMLYYKETCFLLVLGFAVGRLLLRCRKQAGWDFSRLRDPASRLDICLALLVMPFFLYYLAVMFPHYNTSYVDEFRLPLAQVLTSYVKLDLLVWVLVAVVIARIVLILRRGVEPSPLWDGLALAGICFLIGYIILRMYGGYYLAPVDLIAVLYLGRLAVLSVKDMGLGTRLCALTLLILVVMQDLSLSAFRMYERKNVIHAKAEIGRMIQARYESDPENVKRLFFPYAKPFVVMEFASYLNYLGVRVEQTPTPSLAASGVMLVGRALQENGPCGYRPFVCHAASKPDPGDLVVLLPDDSTQGDEWSAYLQQSTAVLISYHARPSIPRSLLPYVNHLRVISTEFSQDQLPDHWLDAAVIVWM